MGDAPARAPWGLDAGPLLQRRGRGQEGAAPAAAGSAGLPRGAGEDEYTLRRNREAFDLLEFLPGMPRDVTQVDTSTTVLGQRIPLPFALSPIGAPRMFHHEGEFAVARAARRAGIPYGISTLATTAVEDVAAQTDTPLWFQLYVWGDRGETKEAIARAMAAWSCPPPTCR
jgi:L-lactate dehydrogenase (cytochrome)